MRISNIMRVVPALIILLCVFGPSIARSDEPIDYILSKGYIEDAAGTLALSGVVDRRVTPYEGNLTKGYTGSVYWIKLVVKNSEDHSDVILSVDPDFVEDVRLFDPQKPDELPRVVGSLHEQGPHEFYSLSRFFRLKFSEDQHEYWIRVSTTSTVSLILRAQNIDQFFALEYNKIFFYSIYLGIGIIIFIISYILGQKNDQYYYKLFSYQNIISLFWMMTILGFSRIWFSPWIPNATIHKIFNVMTCTMPVMVVLFHSSMLLAQGVKRQYLSILAVYLFVYPIELIMLWVGYTREALALNSALILFVSIVFIFLAISLPNMIKKQNNYIPKIYLILFYIILFFAILLVTLPNFAYINVNNPLFYLRPITHGWLHNILMLVLLRCSSIRSHQRDAEIEAELSYKEGQLSVLGRMVREQEEFVAMLTHELKTPLSVIRLVLGNDEANETIKKKAQQAVVSIDHIIDHAMVAARIEGENHQPLLEEYPLTQLLTEIIELTPRPEQVRLMVEGLTTIRTDRTLFTMMVTNLVSNAVKYGYPLEPIDVHARPHERDGLAGFAVEVSNLPGIAGMPDGALVFQKFYRGKRAKKESGAGLGLFLVRSIASYLSGVIDYDPVNGKVRFRIWLPHLAL